MEQLIFIGIILVFSMLEAVARKKREAEPGDVATPTVGPAQVRVPMTPEARLPSYDHDPSFDDAADAASQSEGSSDELIPVDVWEEIRALARGGPPPGRAAPVPEPKPAPVPVPAGSRTTVRPVRVATPPMSTTARPTRLPAAAEVAVPSNEHSVHLTHAAYGTPVHDRLTGFDEDSRGRRVSADGAAVRSLLRGGGAGLRQAVLLQEILGPPVSLKDDPSAG